MKRDQLTLLFTGLHAGDALGATSEFKSPERVRQQWEKFKDQGWPYMPVGEGAFSWRPGQPTDDTDMAACLVRSYLKYGDFIGNDVAHRFSEWQDGKPRDIGVTTSMAIRQVQSGTPWYDGGLRQFESRPDGAANGSLMRNGVVAAMSEELAGAFRISLLQGIITHYNPLCVACCAIQTYLTFRLLNEPKFKDQLHSGIDWQQDFRNRWTNWLYGTEDELVVRWRDIVGEARIIDALARTHDVDDPNFNPFNGVSYSGRSGFVLLTLRIALWALRRSLDGEVPTSDVLPRECFKNTLHDGFAPTDVLGWVALIGHDSDTYGAAAGPLVVAARGQIDDAVVNKLELCRSAGVAQ